MSTRLYKQIHNEHTCFNQTLKDNPQLTHHNLTRTIILQKLHILTHPCVKQKSKI